jgi:hypothetical protein
MFGGVLDAEQLGDLCACGLQRPIIGLYVTCDPLELPA